MVVWWYGLAVWPILVWVFHILCQTNLAWSSLDRYLPNTSYNTKDIIDSNIFSDILTDWENMDKSVRGFHEATWEFFTTERSYVLLLKLAVDVYLAVLLDLQQKGILNEVDIEILLENIKEPIDHIRNLIHFSGLIWNIIFVNWGKGNLQVSPWAMGKSTLSNFERI